MDYEAIAEGCQIISEAVGGDLFNIIAAVKGECLMSDADVAKVSEIAANL